MDQPAYQFDDIGSSFLMSKIRQDTASSMAAEHYHDAYEIYYLLEGERNYFIKNRIYPIQKGDLVFIGMNELHRTIQSGTASHERILINFKPEFISGMFPPDQVSSLLSAFQMDFSAVRLDPGRQELLESLLVRMLAEEKKKGFGYELSIRVLLVEVLLLLTRTLRSNPADAFDTRDPLQNKISEVAGYINIHYAEKITLQQLSRLFLISPHYLSRSFKQVTGFHFIEYLNHVRIKESKRLLRETRESLIQIAGQTGFDSSTHFGRVFKSITGQAPMQYRKNNR